MYHMPSDSSCVGRLSSMIGSSIRIADVRAETTIRRAIV